MLLIPSLQAGAAGPPDFACDMLGGWIIVEQDAGGGEYLVGKAGGALTVPVPPALPKAIGIWNDLRMWLTTPVWVVDATADDRGYGFDVATPGGPSLIQAQFDRRIELAASAISPTGRFTVFVQANNLASEVTVLDAAQTSRWSILLPHEATLASYAISINVSPDERCVAISEQRVDGDGPETWYLDLETQQLRGPVPGFLTAWV